MLWFLKGLKMKTSIVPELFNSRGIEITDDNNVPIKICESSKFTLGLGYFQKPFILIDNLEIGKSKDIEIKRIMLPDLEKLKVRLVSIDIRSASRRNMRNRPGQKVCYMIKDKSDPLEGAIELIRIPTNHYLEMDLTNRRVRIRGQNAYPYVRNENASKWKEVEE